VTNPVFWLALSLLFVSISLTVMLAIAIPALRELARAARSAEKLFETLRREFPPTLQAIRLTGMEISDLTDDVSQGVQSAGNVVKHVDASLSTVRRQAERVHTSTRSVVTGLKVAWKTWIRTTKPAPSRRPTVREASPQETRLPAPREERQSNTPIPTENQLPTGLGTAETMRPIARFSQAEAMPMSQGEVSSLANGLEDPSQAADEDLLRDSGQRSPLPNPSDRPQPADPEASVSDR